LFCSGMAQGSRTLLPFRPVPLWLPNGLSSERSSGARAGPGEPERPRSSHQVWRGSLPLPPDHQGGLSDHIYDEGILLHRSAVHVTWLFLTAAEVAPFEPDRSLWRLEPCMEASSCRRD